MKFVAFGVARTTRLTVRSVRGSCPEPNRDDASFCFFPSNSKNKGLSFPTIDQLTVTSFQNSSLTVNRCSDREMPPTCKKSKTSSSIETEVWRDGVDNASRSRLRQELNLLHSEMEIAQYGRTVNGQFRKKMPRKQSIVRTKKRKDLEKREAKQQEILDVVDTSHKRLRGSKAAQDYKVIEGSIVFGTKTQVETQEEDGLSEVSKDAGDGEREHNFAEPNEGGECPDTYEKSDIEHPEEEVDSTHLAKVSPQKTSGSSEPRKRSLHRLKNFKSQRMAHKHGDALGAHARGQSKLAIEKLKQVAREAPSAPQVYSSLGMVYEDILKDSRRRHETVDRCLDDDNLSEHSPFFSSYLTEAGAELDSSCHRNSAFTDFSDALLNELVDIAKKAYGSYHIAAILCKRDYTLWVRAAEMALEIAHLHSSVLVLQGVSESAQTFHQSESERWLSEAKRDFETADNLHPPGIDVPAKLATVLIELGCLSEALTLLTDLKNRKSKADACSEFESSYQAWLLYANLMLQIGHECIQWEKGVQTNRNYMFRRWLRKFASTFNWRERRLQALCKALEAAAGSTSSAHLLTWLQKRAEDLPLATTHDDESPTSTEMVEIDVQSIMRGRERGIEEGDDSYHLTSSKIEQDLLLRRNEAELADFDKTTRDMIVDNASIAVKRRASIRKELIYRHQQQIADLSTLDLGSRLRETSVADALNERGGVACGFMSSHSIGASCTTVCQISSILMRHMIFLHLFEGAVLVGDTVALYMKERAARHERRSEFLRIRTAKRLSISNRVVQDEAYDEMHDIESDDEDILLSDEDHLTNETGIFLSLKSGALPPELLVLKSLAYVGIGGKDYLAAKGLESVNALVQEPDSWFTKDTRRVKNCGTCWESFRQDMTEPLRKTTALSLTAKVVGEVGKMREMANFLRPLFDEYETVLFAQGFVDQLIETLQSMPCSKSTCHTFDVIVAASRFRLQIAAKIISSGRDKSKSTALIILSLEKSLSILSKMWSIERDRSIPEPCVTLLAVVAEAARLVAKLQMGSDITQSSLENIYTHILRAVSHICDHDGLDLTLDCKDDVLELLSEAPFAVSWMSSSHEVIALRSYNMCVAKNVSFFSGWEKGEFAEQLLRYREVPNLFGVTTADSRTSGFVGLSLEIELEQVWHVMHSIVPETSAFDFRNQLMAVRKTQWYEETKGDIEAAEMRFSIASFGEDSGLSLLLSFAKICLERAKLSRSQLEKNKNVLNALSIILPISQFCLNTKVWESAIGSAAAGANGERVALEFKRIRKFGMGGTVRPSGRESASTKKRALEPQGSETRFRGWFEGENNKYPMRNFLNIPCSSFRDAWHSCSGDETVVSIETKTAMQRLARSVGLLRNCYTEQAIERASLSIATLLLDLAAKPGCRNPFICMQQATLFSSQAAKGGTSDQPFKVSLPNQLAVQPAQALAILGRADCLQAIHFCDEAAYLCWFVVSLCRQRRDHRRDDFGWTRQWKIIAVYAYNVSVGIRLTSNLLNKIREKSSESGFTWSSESVKELQQARADGIAWSATLCGDGSVQKNKNTEEDEGEIDVESFSPAIKVDRSTGFTEVGDVLADAPVLNNSNPSVGLQCSSSEESPMKPGPFLPDAAGNYLESSPGKLQG